jgi:hypothetical protein
MIGEVGAHLANICAIGFCNPISRGRIKKIDHFRVETKSQRSHYGLSVFYDSNDNMDIEEEDYRFYLGGEKNFSKTDARFDPFGHQFPKKSAFGGAEREFWA